MLIDPFRHTHRHEYVTVVYDVYVVSLEEPNVVMYEIRVYNKPLTALIFTE